MITYSVSPTEAEISRAAYPAAVISAYDNQVINIIRLDTNMALVSQMSFHLKRA